LSRSQTPRFCIIFSAKQYPYPNFEYFCGQIFLEQMDAQLVKRIMPLLATNKVKRIKLHILLGAIVVALASCDGIPLGDGYVFTGDYPYCVGKCFGFGGCEVVLPPPRSWTDSVTTACADVVVRVYWDDTTVLAVSCYCDVLAEDTTCWKLDKETGTVTEITPEELHRRVSNGKMRTDYICERYN